MKKEAICTVCRQKQDVPVNPSERTCRFCGNTVLRDLESPPRVDVPNGCSVQEEDSRKWQPEAEPQKSYTGRDMHRLRYQVRRKSYQIQAHREEILRLESERTKLERELRQAEMQNLPIEVVVPKKRMSVKVAKEADALASQIIQMLLEKGVISQKQLDAVK